MTVHLCCFHFLRQNKKIEDVGEENEATTSVIISNEEQINCFDKSPTRQSQQNLVKKKDCDCPSLGFRNLQEKLKKLA